MERLKKEEVAVVSEVASPERVQEPEPLVVAEPEETVDVAMEVASEAKPGGAESRVALEVDEDGGPSAIGVPVSEGKRRRVDDSSGEEEEEVRVAVPLVPLGPAARVPVGPRAERGRGTMPSQWRLVGPERRGELVRLRENILAEGSGRGKVAGVRNGMEGVSFHTRGTYARARSSGNGGVRHEGFIPYRRWR